MAVIVRDKTLEEKLEDERQRRFGDEGGTLSRVLRDIANEHFVRVEVTRKPSRKPTVAGSRKRRPSPSAAN